MPHHIAHAAFLSDRGGRFSQVLHLNRFEAHHAMHVTLASSRWFRSMVEVLGMARDRIDRDLQVISSI